MTCAFGAAFPHRGLQLAEPPVRLHHLQHVRRDLVQVVQGLDAERHHRPVILRPNAHTETRLRLHTRGIRAHFQQGKGHRVRWLGFIGTVFGRSRSATALGWRKRSPYLKGAQVSRYLDVGAGRQHGAVHAGLLQAKKPNVSKRSVATFPPGHPGGPGKRRRFLQTGPLGDKSVRRGRARYLRVHPLLHVHRGARHVVHLVLDVGHGFVGIPDGSNQGHLH